MLPVFLSSPRSAVLASMAALLLAPAAPLEAGDSRSPSASTTGFHRSALPPLRAPQSGDEGGVAAPTCGSTVLTQNADPTSIEILNTVACSIQGVFTYENVVARVFTPLEDFELGCIEFGVEVNRDGATMVEVTVFGDDIVTNPAAVPIAQVNVPIPDGAEVQLFQADLPSPIVFSAGGPFSIQLRTPDRDPLAGGDGGEIYLGSNNNGQSAPSFIKAPTCGIAVFVPFASIGFPGVHIVMSLGGGPPGSCPSADHDCGTTGGPGCTDVECCELVCAVDPFCCETAWDGLCVAIAVDLCGILGPAAILNVVPGLPTSDCCWSFDLSQTWGANGNIVQVRMTIISGSRTVASADSGTLPGTVQFTPNGTAVLWSGFDLCCSGQTYTVEVCFFGQGPFTLLFEGLDAGGFSGDFTEVQVNLTGPDCPVGGGPDDCLMGFDPVDPGFETASLIGYAAVLNNFLVNQGIWGAESATIVTGPEGGVTPHAGSKMLRMPQFSLKVNQTVQVVDVSLLAAQIDMGMVDVTFGARFNAHQDVPAAQCSTLVRFYSGPSLVNVINPPIQNSLTLDTDPSTWEDLSVTGTIPPGTRWIVLEVFYVNASLLGGAPGFVDSTWLCLQGKSVLTGDVNGDGMVDGADLGLLLGVWGQFDLAADLNGDGVVDGADLGLLLGSWGP